MLNNLFKYFPYLLIIMPTIGFFVNTNTPQWEAHQSIQLLLLLPMILPWWGKLISIFVGIICIAISSPNTQETKQKDGAGLR